MRKYNGDQIHHRIMLEFPDGSRRWGYASTMSAMSSHSMPVIACGDDVYKPGDIALANIDIICNNGEVFELLKRWNYTTVKQSADKTKKFGVAMPMDLYDKIKKEADNNNIAIGAKIVMILNEYYDKK